MRMGKECKTIIQTNIEFDIEHDEACPRKVDSCRRCNSCSRYITQMKETKGNVSLIRKSCSKMFFFSCDIEKDEQITKNDHEQYLLGFCVVHLDTLRKINGSQSQYIGAYVPECVLKKLPKSIRGFKYGNLTCKVNFGEEEFEIENANYFSQQNGLTNCCAHAAIKTALRGYDESISCDTINDALIQYTEESRKKGSSANKAMEVSRMAKGLTAEEILKAIELISQSSENIIPLSPILVTAHELPITSFMETIYRAVESKMPVILLLRIPDDLATASSYGGHAVSLVGHTFNKHNWCAYGSGYFSTKKSQNYLSSYLWCDKGFRNYNDTILG